MANLSAISPNRYRVVYLAAGLIATIGATWVLLAPSSKKGASADYKFMHCKTCRSERPYELSFDEMKCQKCFPQKDGSYVPTTESIGNSSGNPWKWFNFAVALEVNAFLGLLIYFLNPRNRQVDKFAYLYMNCPKCKRRLRFRESLVGKDGKCPRCKHFFTFPLVAERQEFPDQAEVSGY